MDGFFAPPDGPGPINGAATGQPVRGLIAPHIDFHRGGPAYAWAYRDLAERGDADVFVVFGTCHAGMADPFALTRKPFETPLGPVPVERDFVDALAARAGQDCFASELAHRNEHSVEFQAVFLRYLYAGRREVTVVPILASFVHEAVLNPPRTTANTAAAFVVSRSIRYEVSAIESDATATPARISVVLGTAFPLRATP